MPRPPTTLQPVHCCPRLLPPCSAAAMSASASVSAMAATGGTMKKVTRRRRPHHSKLRCHRQPRRRTGSSPPLPKRHDRLRRATATPPRTPTPSALSEAQEEGGRVAARCRRSRLSGSRPSQGNADKIGPLDITSIDPASFGLWVINPHWSESAMMPNTYNNPQFYIRGGTRSRI
jgi:hypothetical protein